MTKRILLADDEIHIVRAIELALRRIDCEVKIATDGERAWQFVEIWSPDLLVTDYQMPRMNGLELIGKIRESADFRSMRIIMLTAKGYELPIDQLRKDYELEDVFTKPFSPRSLVERINTILFPPAILSPATTDNSLWRSPISEILGQVR